jgi:predicted ABC-type ATPase
VSKRKSASRIYVLAGTNGAGKSSLLGQTLIDKGAYYFNPDEATKRIIAANPTVSQIQANSIAWHEGVRLLQRAIAERLNYAFETTLGGNTITSLLETAAMSGIEVRVSYIGLNSPELHIERVRKRVQRGGHDVSEEKIRERYVQGPLNLIRLLPHLTELRLYDNTHVSDPYKGETPRPILILHVRKQKIAGVLRLEDVPQWAKPIVMAALEHKQ